MAITAKEFGCFGHFYRHKRWHWTLMKTLLGSQFILLITQLSI